MDVKVVAKTMVDILNRYSKKNNCEKDRIQVKLYFKDNGLIGYIVCKDNIEVEEQSIEEILGLKKILGNYMDIFNLSQLVPLHITCSLIVNSNRLQIPAVELSALVCHNKKEGDKESVRIALYRDKKFLEQVPLKDMFSDDNIQEVMALQQQQ
jgi:hypothetical protein